MYPFAAGGTLHMVEPFLSESRLFSFNFPPKGWAFCNGQTLPINQNQALFSLLGTTYGGNGQTTFALPNLQGRVPMHAGAGFTLGQAAGQTAHTLTLSEMPQHLHFLMATNNYATTNVGTGNVFGKTLQLTYSSATQLAAMAPKTVSNVGGSQPHTNISPYLVLNFCIAL